VYEVHRPTAVAWLGAKKVLARNSKQVSMVLMLQWLEPRAWLSAAGLVLRLAGLVLDKPAEKGASTTQEKPSNTFGGRTK